MKPLGKMLNGDNARRVLKREYNRVLSREKNVKQLKQLVKC
jgi:hypothetical protein